jgi:hypothetical protein
VATRGTEPVGREPRPSHSQVVTAVKDLVYRNSAHIRIARVQDVRFARDSRGRWWVSATAVPVRSDEDWVSVYIYRDSGRWVLFDIGTGIGPGDLPEDVAGKF